MTQQPFTDPEALERSLAALRLRADDDRLTETLHEVLVATQRLFGASGAGLMMVDDGAVLSAVAATDDRGRRLEELQEEAGRGPCVDSLTFDQVVKTSDLGSDDRWPELGTELPALGVRAVLGVPVHTDGVPVGSLNIYRDHPSEFTDDEIDALRAYAGLIGSLLRAALQARERGDLTVQLQHALDNRIVIERAIGLVMGRENVDAVSAFNRLRHTARSAQRKVTEVAGELLSEIPGNP